MEIQPVDLTALAAVVLGSMVVLIPIMGATLRFAGRPLIEALLQSGLIGRQQQQPSVDQAELARLTRRVLELEQALAAQKNPPIAPIASPEPVELRRVRNELTAG
jgi:hypothetical protein